MNKLKASALNTGRTLDVNNDLDEQTLYITKLDHNIHFHDFINLQQRCSYFGLYGQSNVNLSSANGKIYPRYWSVRDSYCQPLILGQCLISAGVSSKPYNWTITRSESCEFILSTL